MISACQIFATGRSTVQDLFLNDIVRYIIHAIFKELFTDESVYFDITGLRDTQHNAGGALAATAESHIFRPN